MHECLKKNHIQGGINSSVNIGLFFGGEMVSCLSISKSRFTDGYEITRICKSLNKNVPIIAQSANDIIGFKEKCEDAGCDDFISKPINREELINKIQKLIC